MKSITDTQLYTQIVEANAPLSTAKIVSLEVREWLESERRAEMLIANAYYANKNDILKKKRTAIGEGGLPEDAKNIADNRIPHSFLRELVDQKAQYILGKPYSIDNEPMNKALGENFGNVLRRLGKDAISKGIAWLHVYYDESGVLSYKRIEPEEIIPLWADNDHTKLSALIRVYDQIYYDAEKKKVKTLAEFWDTKTGVTTFDMTNGKAAQTNNRPMMTLANGTALNWERIPFIAIKYNDDEMPLLRAVKQLIDEYDRTVSDTANLLQDEPNGILVVRNYDGQKLDEFRRNLSTYRAVKVTDDGGIENITTQPDITASNLHLQTLKSNIYAFGRGVDANSAIGANASAEARQYLYAQLDLDCNQLEQGIQNAMRELAFFVGVDDDPGLTLNRDIIINELAAVDMCVRSQGIIGLSTETVLSNHPWVKDPEQEMAAYEAAQKRQIDELALLRFDNAEN